MPCKMKKREGKQKYYNNYNNYNNFRDHQTPYPHSQLQISQPLQILLKAGEEDIGWIVAANSLGKPFNKAQRSIGKQGSSLVPILRSRSTD
jgi:hypothetical protein